jgi:predicted Zn-dependent peptidase
LKIEWYKLASDFNFAVREHLSAFSISGLDENFITSLDLTHQLLTEPNLSEKTWEETKRIIISERDDEQKNPNALSNALAHFHRYGKESRYLKRPSDEQLNATTVKDAKSMISQALQVERTVLYFGPRSPDEVKATILDGFLGQSPTTPTPPHKPNRSFAADSNQVYFFQKEMAQAQVRLEFATGTYDESKAPLAQVFNEYFGGGMAGLVFQELREARALAYSAWAHYFTPSRMREENILVGAIGCQADKTLEAVTAFVELLDNMPINQTRWESAHSAILSTYRTNPIGSGSRPSYAYDVRTLGLNGDPRENRYKALKEADISSLRKFYAEEIKPQNILISIVGDSAKIDLGKLKEFGPLTQVKVGELFNR